MLDDQSIRLSLQVAPLAIQKSTTAVPTQDSVLQDECKPSDEPITASPAHTQMTPPTTPNGSQEDLTQDDAGTPAFRNFLRAYYPFHPACPLTDSTVTLPLDEGDVVMVHSIHTNGWADGTQLSTGARGWLPTNYCETYNPEDMSNLLTAVLEFWDLLRCAQTNVSETYGNQEFIKGIIAGVRCLLVRTNCLTRESPVIQRNEILKQCRKTLLAELSSLVKTAKRLQETLKLSAHDSVETNDIIDQMILRAFKIVVRGARLHESVEEDRHQRAPAAVTVMATVMEEAAIPPTPPAEASAFEFEQGQGAGSTGTKTAGSARTRGDVPSAEAIDTVPQPAANTAYVQTHRLTNLRDPVYSAPANTTSHHTSPANQPHAKRLSATISHRMSRAGPSPALRPENLVSERLNASYDTFLSNLSSFIGLLHLHSQPRRDLALAVRQSANSGGDLLAIVDIVCNQTIFESEPLTEARAAMFRCIRQLVLAARDLLCLSGPDAEDIVVSEGNSRLLSGATSCVKAASDCVAKAKHWIERIGDFEFETTQSGLAADMGLVEHQKSDHLGGRPSTPNKRHGVPDSKSPSARRAHSHEPRLSVDKPLPQVPQEGGLRVEDATRDYPAQRPSSHPQPVSTTGNVVSSVPSASSLRHTLPPLPKLTTTISMDDSHSPTSEGFSASDKRSAPRTQSMTASSTATNSTYLSRDSELSAVSHSWTRASSPDLIQAPKRQSTASVISTSSAVAEDPDEAECKVLVKTYAHELIVKDGQVMGGTLAALVERLTTHESTPDAVFVSTFYLTFRLFCKPVKFAQALIHRFDSVADAPRMATPVRLRVYNLMKGWLESHWRQDTDQEALPILKQFAEISLGPVLASAGKRLLELIERVSSADGGSLVPRQVSAMGKSSRSVSHHVPADTPVPSPLLTRSQLHLLNNWKAGGSFPSVLDFDPLEIARQLTVKQTSIFCAITADELLGLQWTEKNGLHSPHVKAMSALTTELSHWVADTILQYSEVKKRAAVIKQWIKVAHHCLELNNYDGLTALNASLNSSAIVRLRRTWELVSPRRRETLKLLQGVVDPVSNYKVLRARLQQCVPPCLPFLGMILTDLTFVDHGNAPTRQLLGGPKPLYVVNFDKHSRTAKTIGELQRFQIPSRLSEVPDLQEWIQASIVRVRESGYADDGTANWRRSLKLEPREPGPPPEVSMPTLQRADLFGWILRDRGHGNHSPAPL